MKERKRIQLISLAFNYIKQSTQLLILTGLVTIAGLTSGLLTPPLATAGGGNPDLMVISNLGVYLNGLPGDPPSPGVTFIDINTDDLIVVEFDDIAGMPGGTPQQCMGDAGWQDRLSHLRCVTTRTTQYRCVKREAIGFCFWCGKSHAEKGHQA